jgi:NAD(P)-dependent dehydrogenase (short-subunit alcohol dehydrogenase family)
VISIRPTHCASRATRSAQPHLRWSSSRATKEPAYRDHQAAYAGGAAIEQSQCLTGRVYPADVARMVLWLAADDSSMCTAQNWVVDGGWL